MRCRGSYNGFVQRCGGRSELELELELDLVRLVPWTKPPHVYAFQRSGGYTRRRVDCDISRSCVGKRLRVEVLCICHLEFKNLASSDWGQCCCHVEGLVCSTLKGRAAVYFALFGPAGENTHKPQAVGSISHPLQPKCCSGGCSGVH